MKLPSSSWVIIRWAVVSALFAVTVAIAVDQVKTRDEAAIVAEAAVSASKEEQRKVNTENGKLRLQLNEALGKLGQLGVAAKNLDEAREMQIDALVAQNTALKNYAVAEETSPPERAVARPYAFAPPAPIPIEIPGEAAPAPWYPLATSVVTKRIKDDAVLKWKDNYAMVNHEIERQSKGYNELLAYYKTANPVVKDLLAKAAAKWENNYAQTAYEVERQLEAKRKLDGR